MILLFDLVTVRVRLLHCDLVIDVVIVTTRSLYSSIPFKSVSE